MTNYRRLFGTFVVKLTPLMIPFTTWFYRSRFSRKIAIRLSIFLLSVPVIGYFRTPYVLRKFNDQVQSQNSIKETQMKQALGEAQLQFSSSDNNFDYMVLIKSERVSEDEELFGKQKVLFSLNNQILNKTQENESYFEGVKFMFFGEQRVFDVLKTNLPKEQDKQFDFISKDGKKGGMSIPRPDSILLISKQENGDNKILMEWPFDPNVNLKAIVRQITKHKHKRYVQSMNF